MARDDLDDLIGIEAPLVVTISIILWMLLNQQRQRALSREPSMVRNIHRNAHMSRILDGGFRNCVDYIRMRKDTFMRLCAILRHEAVRSSTNNTTARNGRASRVTSENIMNEKVLDRLDRVATSIERARRTWKEKLSEALWSMDGFDDDDLEMAFEELRVNKKLAEDFYLRKPSLRQKWLQRFISDARVFRM